MQNNIKNEQYNKIDCNDSGKATYTGIGDFLMRSQFKIKPASPEFQADLKAQILAARQKKRFMPNLQFNFGKLFTVRHLSPVLATLVIVAMLITSIKFWGNDFSGLIINPAYANDNFVVTATEQDSLGVSGGTAFVIKSKQPIDIGDLKNNLQIIPAVEFNLEKVSEQEFRVVPKNDLQSKIVYNLKINASYVTEKGLTIARNYSWAFQVKDEFKVIGTLPADRSTAVPLNTGVEIIFSHFGVKDYRNNFSIEPRVNGKFEIHGKTLVFAPTEKLIPGQIYKVIVGKDVSVEGSDKILTQDYVFQFETAGDYSFEKEISFAPEENDFSSNDEPIFKMDVYNYSYHQDEEDIDVNVEVFNLPGIQEYINDKKFVDNIPSWIAYSKHKFLLPTENLNKVFSGDLKIVKNNFQSFLPLYHKFPNGYYLISVQDKEKKQICQALFQVSDLAVFINSFSEETMIWINDLTTETVAAGAEVIFPDSEFQTKVDNQGFAILKNKELFKNDKSQKKYLVIKKNDRSAVYGFYFTEDLSFGLENNYWNYFYTDRPMYKMNDTVMFWGFLKPRANQSEITNVNLELTKDSWYDSGSRNSVYVQKEVEVRDNFFNGEFAIKNINPGYYTLKIKIDNENYLTKYINIEDYVKPAYNLSLNLAKKNVLAGEKLVGTASAKFFEGTSVPKLSLKSSLKGLKLQNEQTDQQGQVNFEIATNNGNCDLVKNKCNFSNPSYQSFQIRSEYAEEAEIYASGNYNVYNSLITAVVKGNVKQNQVKITGTTYHVDIDKLNERAGNNNSNELNEVFANARITGTITEVRHISEKIGETYDFITKTVNPQYSYRTVETIGQNFELVTDNYGNFSYDFPAQKDVEYIVNILAFDQENRPSPASFYAYNYYNKGEDNYRLKLNDEENNDYKFDVGELVELVYQKNDQKLPNSDKPAYLFWQSQNGLRDYEIKNSADYQFVFSKKEIPNIYVSAVYFDGKHFRDSYGSRVNILYDYAKNEKLNVKISANKEKYKPGEKVKLQIETTDQNQKPVSASVNLNLVDEAYYALVFDYVDPLSAVYGTINSGGVNNYKSHQEIKLFGFGAEGGGCFLAGTKIQMADGSEKEIQNIKIGDQILTIDGFNFGQMISEKVVNTTGKIVGDYLIINNKIRVTGEHRMFINGAWQLAKDLKIGDALLDLSGKKIAVVSIQSVKQNVKVYNFEVENQHTYFAEGVYVHNDKGEGRSDFADTAIFKTIKTGPSGQGDLEFYLPDNITSWRITGQAIANDLQVGKGSSNLLASLPVFADMVLAEEYLLNDQPEIKVRVFGDKLTQNDQVISSLVFQPNKQANRLDLGEKTALAFESVYYPIEQLAVGENKFTAEVKTDKGQDILTKTAKVIESRLTKKQVEKMVVSVGTKLNGSQSGRTEIVFSDGLTGKIYERLTRLMYNYTDRVDDLLTSKSAVNILNDKFQKDFSSSNFRVPAYQTEIGGISLLPYSSEDLALSAKIASLKNTDFDQEALKNYFYSVLNKQVGEEELAIAFFGLSAFEEPILNEIQARIALNSYEPKEGLYLALAAYNLGDENSARQVYTLLKQKYGKIDAPYVKFAVGKDENENYEVTSLAMILAANLQDENAVNIFDYLELKSNREYLPDLDFVLAINGFLNQKEITRASFDWQIGDKIETIDLPFGQTYTVSLLPEELNQIQFIKIEGDVSSVFAYDVPADDIKTGADPNLSVEKKYFVKDKETNEFFEGDLVKIKIATQTGNSPENYFEIKDSLPSGLKLVTNLRTNYHDSGNSCKIWPHNQNGNEVKFSISNNNENYCNGSYYYYARVVSAGSYLSEPIYMRSLVYDNSFVFGPDSMMIKIRHAE